MNAAPTTPAVKWIRRYFARCREIQAFCAAGDLGPAPDPVGPLVELTNSSNGALDELFRFVHGLGPLRSPWYRNLVAVPSYDPLAVRRVCRVDLHELELQRCWPAGAHMLLRAGTHALVGGAVRDMLRGASWRVLDFARFAPGPGLSGPEFRVHRPLPESDLIQVIEVGDFDEYVRSFDSPANQVWIWDGFLWTLGDDDPRERAYTWNVTSCRGPANYLHRAARMAQRGLHAPRLDLDMALYAATYRSPVSTWRVSPREAVSG